jgi:hypothetical protein
MSLSEERRNRYGIFDGKFCGKGLLGKQRRRWVDIKVDINVFGLEV